MPRQDRQNKAVLTAMLVGVVLELAQEGLAVGEGAVGLIDCVGEGLGDEVLRRDVRRVPSTTVDTAVQPVETTVRAVRGGGLLYGNYQYRPPAHLWEHSLVAPLAPH